MSIDYELYLSDDITQSMLNDFGFVKTYEEKNKIIKGDVFEGKLHFIIAKCHLDDSFIREEVGFLPIVKIILSPNLEQYNESMNSIIKVINTIIDINKSIKFYQNNQTLLLEKKEENIYLYSKNSDWWEEYLSILSFMYTKKK